MSRAKPQSWHSIRVNLLLACAKSWRSTQVIRERSGCKRFALGFIQFHLDEMHAAGQVEPRTSLRSSWRLTDAGAVDKAVTQQQLRRAAKLTAKKPSGGKKRSPSSAGGVA
jgi:hypothetical protein